MRRKRIIGTVAIALVFGAHPASAQLSVTRLDCGEIHLSNMDDYSDTFQYVGQQKTLTSSCYLIRNGERFLLWDSGLPADLAGQSREEDGMRLSLRRTIAAQLAQIHVRPDQIDFVGLSHYHFDHTGQAGAFPNATLLLGSGDWEAVKARPERARALVRWTGGGGQIVAAAGDHDVFGDGQVIMLATPGHTPGHRSLLVRLRRNGPLLLSGDLYHFRENVTNRGVPGFNSSRADTLASMDRFDRIGANLRATIVLQHEPADITKLPAFPEALD